MNIGIDIDDTIIETAEFVTPRLSEFYRRTKTPQRIILFPQILGSPPTKPAK